MTNNNFIIRIPVWMITIYQRLIAPVFPRACRFHPTCSEYTKQALLKYGLFKGLLIGVRRILRCNPFNAGGYDPITGAEK